MSIFTDVFVKPPRRSKQVLDHPVITTTDFGKIIPILVEDVLPGDIFKCSTAADIKLFPTLAPLRQGIEVRVDYFFVPNRLLWKDWQEFITGGTDGTSAPTKPFTNADEQNVLEGSLWDYFGLPIDIPAGTRGNENDLDVNISEHIDVMPFRAYNLIWNEYYRDETLDLELPVPLTSGKDTQEYHLQYRRFKKDYFTSALPWTQRGPQVTLPINGTAPINAHLTKEGGIPSVIATDQQAGYYRDGDPSEPLLYEQYDAKFSRDSEAQQYAHLGVDSNGTPVNLNHVHTLVNPVKDVGITGTADLSDATGITINEFRRLNSVQKWLERNARAGGRYVEQILSHFGVRTPDYRLDRPEYLGGNKQVLGMAEVLQTSETATSPQGSRAGVGFGNMLSKCKKYRITEHGWVLGLMSIIPAQNIYSDGIQRKWSRETKFDYYFPEFQNLGEQAIKQKEIYAYGNNDQMKADFGYTPRYAEYRYHPGIVTAAARTSMAYWHMARLFNSAPALNSNFINTWFAMDDFDRLFPTDESLGDRFVVTMQHFERLKRPMQKNPNPSL